MNEQTMEITGSVEDLVNVLKRDISHIEYASSKLNELRGFVIKRDEKGLSRLLEDIRAEAKDYQANEQRRGLIRKELAEFFGCTSKELTLSFLKNRVTGAARAAIAENQERLKALVSHLKVEYASTAALLSDCARINSALLRIVFDRSRKGLVCYDSTGLATRESDAAFMNMHL
jgi:hypothetical protein